MGEEPLVSVFIPYYNDEAFIKDSIESVLNQTYKNFELILLNHASTDSSREIAHSYKDNRIIHLNVEKNLGAGSGVLMLEFLKVAKGKYVKLFCADDIMKPDCIEVLVNYLEENPDKDIVFADMDYVDIKKNALNTKWSEQRPHFSFEHDELEVLKWLFRGIGFIPYPSSMVRTEVLRCANIDRTFVMLIDMGIWADILIKGKKLKFIKNTLVWYRIHNGQTASAHSKRLVMTRSTFESLKYISIFNRIKDVNLIKFLCSDVPFIDTLTAKDIEFFPFIIAYHNLKNNCNPYRYNAYMYIHDLMNDDTKREKITERFGFGIKEFRELYSYVPPLPQVVVTKQSPFKTWKNKLYSKNIKNLRLGELAFLYFRRSLNILTLKEVKRKKALKEQEKNKPPQYTL